jgi:hypothetical protein
LSDHLFEGEFTHLLEKSITVPRGQIQPQKKRPRKIVRNKIISAGQNRRDKVKLSIKSNRGIKGLNLRNRSDDSVSS